MFDFNLKQAITYIRHNGLNHFVYKIYKKTMYKYYEKKLIVYRQTAVGKLDIDSRIIPFKEQGLQKEITSKVSIILIYEGDEGDLERCLDSIYSKSTYKNYELFIITYTEIDTPLFEKLKSQNIEVVSCDKSFGLSNAVNNTVKMVEGEYIVLLCDRIEIVVPNWIEELLNCISSPEVGIAGALRSSPNNTVQQINIGNMIGAASSCEVLEDMRSCLMININLFEKCKGLNEYFFTSYTGIDLCLRVRQMGKTVQCTPREIIKKINNQDEKVIDIMDKALFLNCWEEICL